MTPDHTLRLTRAHESTSANTFRLVKDPPVFVRGEGPWLLTADGTRYLDLVCGSATTSLGHGHPAHLAALQEVMATGIMHTGTRLPSPFRAALYDRLLAILPPELTRIQLVNSGAEAIEAAIKSAQFATGRSRLVAFDGGYHGRTLGALSLTSGDRIRAPFHLLEASVDILPYPGPSVTPDQALAAAETLFAQRSEARDLPALVLVEAVQAVSGLYSAGAPFLVGLSSLCRAYDIPLALDEIWNGIGRTGRWFGFDHSEIYPDFVIMGKSLSGGLPLSALAASERFLGRWPAGMHTSTFQGNPMACAMAVATLDTITNDNLLGHVTDVIAPMMAATLEPLLNLPGISDVRMAGAQVAIEFRDPWGQHDPARAVELQKKLLYHHILAYGGGRAGECLMLVPPITLAAKPLSEALSKLKELVESIS